MKNILKLIMAVFSLAIFSSCDEELNSKELYAYIRPSQDRTMTVNFQYNAEGNISAQSSVNELKFPVFITRSTSVDVKILIGIDNSLVEKYNEEHSSAFLPYPENALSSINEIVIKSGEMLDSCIVRLETVNLLRGKEYLLPLVIKSVSSEDKGITISSNIKAAFVEITTDNKVQNIDRTGGEFIGKEMDRALWRVTASDFYASEDYKLEYMTDGDEATGWRGDANKYSLINVDMGSVKSVKGIRLLSLFGNKVYAYLANPKKMSVSVSSDNETWTNYGVSQDLLRPANATAVAVTNDIKFVYASPVRYVQLKVEGHWSSTRGSGLSELNFIE